MRKTDILRIMNHWLAWKLIGVRQKVFWSVPVAGFSVAGSLLWAIPVVTPYLPNQFPEPVIPSASFIPIARGTVPSELAWFFIQFRMYPRLARSF